MRCVETCDIIIFSLHRSLRKWWMALPANRRQVFRQWVWQRRWHLAACVVAAVVIVSLFLLTHLDEAPVTGRTRLLVFSRQNYIDLAAVTSEMVRIERGWGGKKTRVRLHEQKCLSHRRLFLRKLSWRITLM